MSNPEIKSSPDEAMEAVAARWIARRDRGLTGAEEAAYRKWLGENPRHEAAMNRPARNWSALDQLAEIAPTPGGLPNPDLLAPPRRRALWFWFPMLAAAAAAIAVVYFVRVPKAGHEMAIAETPAQATVHQSIVHLEPERLTLEDGSVVELKAQAKVEVQFTVAERRVRLERGEAYFIVAKNPQRPFVVVTPQVEVRAVGTEFSVGFDPAKLSVLVTEGKVRVDDNTGAVDAKSPRELSSLVAGQQGVVDLDAHRLADGTAITVTGLTPAEIDRALAWRNLQLELTEMALGDVVTEFNRYNAKKLVVGDAQTAAVRVTGVFRANNVDAFVRLLDYSFGVTAFPQETGIVLRKTHGR